MRRSGITTARRDRYGSETIYDSIDVAEVFDLRRATIALTARMIDGRAPPTELRDLVLAHCRVEARDFAAWFFREPAAKARGMNTDISVDMADIHHGDDWYRFLASCKYFLGAEGGALPVVRVATGEAAYAELQSVIAQRRDLVSKGIAARDYEVTVATLERVARNLGWQGESR